MLFFIFPTLLTSAKPTDFQKNDQKNHFVTSDFFDLQNCCSIFNCEKLGNGICDQELSLITCAWDGGDCGDCYEGCFLDMIGNGICDENCFNLECQFDGYDCDNRILVEIEKDDENLSIRINSQNIEIAKNVETIIDSFIFDNVTHIEGEISYQTGILKFANLTINGEITIKNFTLEESKNLNISIQGQGIVRLQNICFKEKISISIQEHDNYTIKSIKELESIPNDPNNCINFTYTLTEGFFRPIFSESSQNNLTINETSQNTIVSNLYSDFYLNIVIKNSKLIIKDSHISSYQGFLIEAKEGSNITMMNSNLIFNNTYFDIKDSKALIIDSDLGDCKNNKVAELSNGILTVENIKFKNCLFEQMDNITKMTTCNQKQCNPLQSELKSCPDGEMDMIVCTKCPDNYYRFRKQGDLFCFKCPDTMICTNGEVKPAKDIYQFEDPDMQHVFRPCFRNNSCIDPSSEKWSINEQCEEEYKGKFCASCGRGNTSIGKFKCGKCPNHILNAFILLISIAVVSAMIIYFIKSTVISSFEPSEFYSIAIRIGINYFQVIYLCLQFRIAWPSANDDDKTQGNNAGTTIKEGSNYYFSLQCLIDGLEEHKDYYYARVTFMTIFPIIVFILSIFYLLTLRFWSSKFFFKVRHRSRSIEDFRPSNLRIYTPVAFILPFLLIYPYVITYTLSPLACDSLESSKPYVYSENIDYSEHKYLMEVPDILCNWSEHYRKIIWATGFSLIVWGFGVPIFIFYKLYQKRKNLFKYEVKYTFGFLISGYLHERFYWEFIIFIKKLMIVFLTVFMQTGYSITLQSILLITFLIAGFILQIYFKPYITDELNKLEIAGTLAATITVLAAIIYTESNENSRNLQLFLVFIIIVVNICYIIYWLSFISKELFTYIITSIDFLKKRFLKRDGFDREISKEYKNVDFVYIKEYQKLFTQAKFNEKVPENYLGKEPSYQKLIKRIISTSLEQYKNGLGPNFRTIMRLPTLVRLNQR